MEGAVKRGYRRESSNWGRDYIFLIYLKLCILAIYHQ